MATIQSQNLLSQVKAAEEEAAELVRKAEEERRRLLTEAEERATRQLQSAHLEARKVYASAISRAKAEAEELEHQNQADMIRLAESAAAVSPDSEEEAIKLVVERFFEKWR